MTTTILPPTLEGLNAEQRAAVSTTDGPVLVIAGPGSGKTRVIIQRIAHLIDHAAVAPERIMAVTFTNKAAAELVNRLSKAVPPQAARSVHVSTFHRLAGLINRRYSAAVGLSSDYTIYDHDDQLTVVRRAMEQAGISPTNDGIRPTAVLSAISRAKSLLLDPDTYAEYVQDLDSHNPPEAAANAAVETYPHYQRELELSGAVDFDDIITRSVRILSNHDRIRQLVHRTWRYMMVDEYQDTNKAQHELTRLLTGPGNNICVVGDPNQSIYGWRNALIENIMEFPRNHPGTRTVRLGRNYRSTGTVVAAADALISQNDTRIQNPLRSQNDQGPPVRIATANDSDGEAFWTINNMLSLVRAGECTWNDCAIMYRTNAQSRPLEELCIHNSIKYRLIGGTRFYQRQEVKDVLAFLRVIHNAGDTVSLQRIINLPPRAIGAVTIDRILTHAGERAQTMMQAVRSAAMPLAFDRPELAERPTAAVGRFVDLIDQLKQATDNMTLAELIDLLIKETALEPYVKGQDNGAERWDNVLELRGAAAIPDYDGAPARHTLAPFLEHTSLFTDTDDYDESQNLLTLITMHQAKGLEYHAVGITGLSEGLLPHSRTEDIEEERRLCYVGMTRAKRHLFMSWPERSNQYGHWQTNSPSRFLDELPKDLMQEEFYPE